MSSFQGMDDESVGEQVERMSTASERIAELAEGLRDRALTAAWVGPDADAFRDGTTGTVDRLLGWAQDCRSRAGDLRKEIGEQDRASSPDGLTGTLGGLLADAAGRRDAVLLAATQPPGLADGLVEHDDPDDDIAPITPEDITRPGDADLVDPTSVHDIVQNLQAVDAAQTDDATSIRIQQIVGDDGVPRYIVYVPGSFGDPGNLWNPSDTHGNPMDWNQNAGALLGGETDSSQAVQAAMEAAGIPYGADVVLAGHSQGGIVTTNLAASSEFNGGAQGYHVTDVVTFGSPVENKTLPEGTHSINFSNVGGGGWGEPYRPGDPVSLLDEPFMEQYASPLAPQSSHQEVSLEAPRPGNGDAMANHAIGAYAESLQNPSEHAQGIISDYETSPSMGAILAGGQEQDTIDASVSRAPGTY